MPWRQYVLVVVRDGDKTLLLPCVFVIKLVTIFIDDRFFKGLYVLVTVCAGDRISMCRCVVCWE